MYGNVFARRSYARSVLALAAALLPTFALGQGPPTGTSSQRGRAGSQTPPTRPGLSQSDRTSRGTRAYSFSPPTVNNGPGFGFAAPWWSPGVYVPSASDLFWMQTPNPWGPVRLGVIPPNDERRAWGYGGQLGPGIQRPYYAPPAGSPALRRGGSGTGGMYGDASRGFYIPARRRYIHYPPWFSAYFHDSYAWFPFYCPEYVTGVTVISPFAYYGPTLPLWISATAVYSDAPGDVWLGAPTYQDGVYSGWSADPVESYYLSRSAKEQAVAASARPPASSGAATAVPAIRNAIDDMRTAWMESDITGISRYVSPDKKIAVFLRGKYQYSLDGAEYLDMTRDAMRNTHTTRFSLDGVTQKAPNVTVVSVTHAYTDKQGEDKSVHIEMSLESIDNMLVLTQIALAPDHEADASP